MNKYKNKIAYIVPTKDRPDDLRKLLASFRTQTVIPDQILIIDGSDNDIKYVLDEYRDLHLDYIRVRPPGLTRQRNAGKKLARPDITLVGYLDDDIVMEKDATEKMLEFFEAAPADHGGASFNIVNNIVNSNNILTRIFLINDGRKGVILSSGFNAILHPVEKETYVEWLSGGATVWRKEIIDSYDYDEFYGGYGHFDDLDFSCQAGRKYKMIVLKDSKVWHFIAPIKVEKCYAFAISDVINRFHFVKKFPERFKILHCLWATFGLISIRLVYGIVKRDRESIERVKGYLVGLYKIAINDVRSHDTNIR